MSLTLDYFMDENLKLYQDKEHFRFNTDTKLLAKFVHLKKQERILDIGTNNAALLVYFDQFNVKELVGVEILEETSKVAQKNADMFIKHPVKIVNQPIQRYEDDLFDVIVSNPPYFKMDANQLPEQLNFRHLGRMEENLTLEQLVFHANRLLKSYGRFYMVHRPFRLPEIMAKMCNYGLEPKRMRLVYPYVDKEPNMVLIEGRKGGNPRMTVEAPLIVYEKDGSYTQELLKLYAGE